MSEQSLQEQSQEKALPEANGTRPAGAANGAEKSVEENPWAGIIGVFKDDPGWDAVMKHIWENRRKMDEDENANRSELTE